MTSQSNTFRLQRLTKTMGTRQQSQSQYEPKETFKLAALNSISRGVKYNALSYMSGRQLNKLRKQPEVGGDIEYESAHVNLEGVRKNYDSAHKQKNFRQNSISKLKEEKRKLSIMEGELLDNKEKGDKQVKQLNSNLEATKMLFTQADMQRRVLESMRARLKADKVVYDQRKFDMEKELRFLKKQKEVITIDRTDISESDDRTNKVYKKFLNQLKKEQEEREAHLANLEAMIEEKQRVNQRNQFRSREIIEIAERAMQDKDESEKSWEKLYLTNKMVSKLLRDKMDREMHKFFVVESAFKTIKIATGVTDAETFVQKFLNKEAAYGDLLEKISNNQKKILELKSESKRLKNQFKELESEKEVIDSTKRHAQSLEGELKKMSEIEKKEEKSEVFVEKIRSWLCKSNKKINNILGKQYATQVERSLKAISASFIEYLNNISKEADAAKDLQLEEEKTFKQENIKNEKNLIRIRENHKIEDDELETHEEQNDQDDMIEGQRSEIVRGNQKFMKEVKKKYEEKRRLAAQAASPKKNPEKDKPAAPVKKPQDD